MKKKETITQITGKQKNKNNMKKLIYLFVAIALCGCESKDDVQSDINILKQQRKTLTTVVESLNSDKANLRSDISELETKVKELKIYESGVVPQYILKLNLSQSHSLDLGKMIKDAMNDVDFEMPVSKEFYESVKKGDKLVDDFRVGSFIMDGSFGNWDLKVTGKEIRKPNK